MKDKKGNKITVKEFFHRWREGIKGITEIQKLKVQVSGTRISLIGLLAGLFISIYGWKNLWWVTLILTGAIMNTYIQYIGQKQQYKFLKDLEESKEESIDDILNDEVTISLDGGEKKGMSATAIKIKKLLKEEEVE